MINRAPDKSLKILVIDDDEVDLRTICRLLGQLEDNFELQTAVSLEEARVRLSEERFDCVLIDYLVPPHTGLELLAEYKNATEPPYIGFVMITGAGNEQLAVQALKAGAHDYVVKDKLSKSELYRAVRNATESAKYAGQAYYQKLALENFAGLVAHDLISPLNSVIGYLDLILKNEADQLSSTAREYICNSRSSGKYMENVVRSLLSYAKAGTTDEQTANTDSAEIMQTVLQLLQSEIQEKKARIHVTALPSVEVRKIEFIQLFQNLLANAIRHNDKTEPIVHVSTEETEEHILFKIEDNGIGISEEQAVEIFKPLNKGTSRDENGLGLGLATCKKIVKAHNGRIWCEPGEKEGTVFFVALPITTRQNWNEKKIG
ncbi:sensor histidine kinase [Sneathiella aquimaris]|uniref:sensor histidine kinase n=1 Tax=Sneathiella aquimaris TaxID=2599305 RepID=UPI00146F0A83|nr:hybrid sensor histidine kinase/response regulator [Sneathiella aquimaris]